CQGAPNTACGACADMPAVGASCASANCGRGQICNSASTCQAPGAQGASCMANIDCGYKLGCIGATGGAAGTCQPVVSTETAACDRRAGPLCDGLQDLFCQTPTGTTAGTCTSEAFAAGGAACGLSSAANSLTLRTGGALCVGAR